MAEADIISGLLNWLEDHLDLPLRLDNVAAKSGYSKWYLQRMFRYVAGRPLGAYTRARRLSQAAVALRISGRSISDIALQYHFDSQQTFSRTFKKQFGITPGVYRQSADWSSNGLCLPIHMEAITWPQPDFIILIYGTAMPLLGLIRRPEPDIELFSLSQKEETFPDCIVRCHYFIPIRQ